MKNLLSCDSDNSNDSNKNAKKFIKNNLPKYIHEIFVYFFQPQITPSFLSNEEKWTLYPYILNVAIKSNQKDEEIAQMCSEFCHANVDTLKEYEIKRVTFIVIRSKEFPKYFTFRARLNYR